MNNLIIKLSGGDLRSDGRSNEVVEEVLNNLELFDKLIEGIHEPDEVIRGRTADALEKIARFKSELLVPYLEELIKVGSSDPIPMVRWHIAMILGHLSNYKDKIDIMTKALLELIDDKSILVKSWSIVSLAIIGKRYPLKRKEILKKIKTYKLDRSIAVRSKVEKALGILQEDQPIPDGWIKIN